MTKFLDWYSAARQNLSNRIAFHLVFWAIVTAINWELLYGNFPKIGEGETVYFFVMVITNLPIFYYLIYHINQFNIKQLFLGVLVLFFVYQIITFYSLEFVLKQYPSSFYLKRWRTSIGHVSFDSLTLNRALLAHSFGTNMIFIFIPLLSRLIVEIFFRALHRKQLEEQNLQLELDYLRSQVNPHFLFNTLNNIYGLVLENQKASESILKLADLMRYSLYETGDNLVLLERELKFIQEYIDLERLRLNKDKRIDFELEGKPDGLKIKPLILVTFIENAIKHGLGKSNSAAFVEITIRLADQELLFVCMNSIPEKIQISETPKEEGIGLKNTKRRLDHYYRSNYSLRTNQTEKSYKVELRMHMDY